MIFPHASVATNIPIFPHSDKIRVYLFDGASYDATVEAFDDHWNLLAIYISFESAIKTMSMVEISENRSAMDVNL